MQYINTGEIYEISLAVQFTGNDMKISKCPECGNAKCYKQLVQDEYHGHADFKCVNCDLTIDSAY